MNQHPIIALMMEAVHTSETSVYFNETTRRYIPEGCHLQYPVTFPMRSICIFEFRRANFVACYWTF
jgi:hypothetical protein